MQYTVDFQVDHLVQALAAARELIATPQEVLGSIGESLLNVGQDRHDQGVDPDGKPWEELKASTIAATPGRKGGPLNRTGRMLRNYHYQVRGDTLHLGFDQGDGFPAIYHQDGSRAHVISARKAKALHFGGMFRKRVNHPGLPVRRLVGFPESDQQLTGELLADHLALALNRAR